MTPRQWQYLVAAAWLAAAVLVQYSVLSRLPFPAPDLVACAVVGVALACGRTTGTIAGFVTGLVSDILPPADGLIGSGALTLVVVAYIAGGVRDPRGMAPFERGALVAGLTGLAGVLDWVLGAALIAAPAAPAAVLPLIVLIAVLTGIVALVMVPAIGSTVRRAGGGARRPRRLGPVSG